MRTCSCQGVTLISRQITAPSSEIRLIIIYLFMKKYGALDC